MRDLELNVIAAILRQLKKLPLAARPRVMEFVMDKVHSDTPAAEDPGPRRVLSFQKIKTTAAQASPPPPPAEKSCDQG